MEYIWIISMQYKFKLAYKVILFKLLLSKIIAVNPGCDLFSLEILLALIEHLFIYH